MPEKE